MLYTDYRDVPADDYLASDDFMYRNGTKERRTSNLIGPHQNREMTLMRQGLKPCAMIDTGRMLYWQADDQARHWPTRKVGVMGTTMRDVVALPGEEWRIDAIERLYRRARERGHMVERDHARLGMLFGYPKDAIRAFLNRNL